MEKCGMILVNNKTLTSTKIELSQQKDREQFVTHTYII